MAVPALAAQPAAPAPLQQVIQGKWPDVVIAKMNPTELREAALTAATKREYDGICDRVHIFLEAEQSLRDQRIAALRHAWLSR